MTDGGRPSDATVAFRQARDYLLAHREDYDTAYRDFRWPQLDTFNYATDWFDVLAAEHPDTTGLWVVEEDGSDTRLTFAELSLGSQRLAGFLDAAGIQRGDRVLLVLGNCAPLWVAMLACIRLGAVMIPATTLLTAADLRDRVERGEAKAVVAAAADAERFGPETERLVRVSVGAADGWLSYEDAVSEASTALPGGGTAAADPMLLYFTSGTTA
ncbi:MAG: acetyl-CoA synthetase [Nocardioidaceae bacterium]|nr:acetyl-CoA synthetase [Nocardioidaceae bacterium]